MEWLFHASDPMGGAAGEAFANTLKSPGMLPEHVLAREAIQNSVDAGNGVKVKVRFRESAVKGVKKTAFVQAADLGSIAERSKELSLSEPNCLATLDIPQKELCLLYVECWRRFKSDQACRLNFDQGPAPGFLMPGCG